MFLGRISYALYLWHVPVFVALGVTRSEFAPKAGLAIAVSLSLAVASSYFVERRFLPAGQAHARPPRWSARVSSGVERARSLTLPVKKPTWEADTLR